MYDCYSAAFALKCLPTAIPPNKSQEDVSATNEKEKQGRKEAKGEIPPLATDFSVPKIEGAETIFLTSELWRQTTRLPFGAGKHRQAGLLSSAKAGNTQQAARAENAENVE